MHECLEKCEYFKRIKTSPFCTYELGGKGPNKIGYRGLSNKKVSTRPPLWCPLRKKKI